MSAIAPTGGQTALGTDQGRALADAYHAMDVFAFASRVRGLHVVAGFPGETRTDLDLQAAVGKAVAERARREAPGCRQIEIVATALVERPASPQSPWAERWSVWRCGQVAAYVVRFAPKAGGGATYAIGN